MKKKICLFGISATLLFSLTAVSGLGLVKAEEPTAYESLHSLIQNYYEGGVYKKDTKIYVDPAKIDEDLSTYFHAKATSLEKTTYYAKDALWMSRGNGTYSYYGTSYSDTSGQNPAGVTNATATEPLVTPASPAVILNGANMESMEAYYVTLHDFLVGTHTSAHSDNKTLDLTAGWEVNEGVYTSTSDDVIDAFRNFTAPLWLGKDATNANYIDYTKATVEEVGTNLIMKLWIDEGDVDKLVDGVESNGTDLLFSKAVITKPNLGLDLQKYSKNLQTGLGTDFEGYSPDNADQAKLFDPSSTATAGSQGTWYADSNGIKAFALQSGYKIRLVQEDDGNVALKVGGMSQKELFRVGINLTEEVCEPGTYVAKIKIKRGPEATIPQFFFKINNGSRTDKNVPLQYQKDGSTSSVTGFYYNNTKQTGTELDFEFATEWTEYSTTFTIDEGSAVDNATSVCAAFVMYTPNSKDTYTKDYLLIDDFELYRVENQGTDFEGYNTTDHNAYFTEYASGYKTDSNGNTPLYVQSGDHVNTQLVEESDGNIAVHSTPKDNGATRVHFDVNDAIKEPGIYKVKIKIKLGENSESIDRVGFRINSSNSFLASGGLSYRTYFKYGDEVTLTTEWAVYETILVIKSDDDVVSAKKDLFMSLFYYPNDKTLKSNIYFDDLEIYQYSFE